MRMGGFCKKQKAFALTEVIVALVLVALLAVSITPALSTYFRQNRVKAATEILYDDMLLARTTAIARSAAITLVFQTGTNWCYGTTTASTCACNTANACNLGQTTSAEYPNTTLAITGFTANAVTFDAVRATPNIVGSTATATVSATDGAEQVTLTLNPLGTTSLCSSGTVGGYGC
jgi:prepilin-type N-terminal cleavage/methylation domain-containing protein